MSLLLGLVSGGPVSYTKTIAITGVWTPQSVKQVRVIKNVGSVFVPTLSRVKALRRTIVIGSIFSVTMARSTAYKRTIAVTSAFVSLVRERLIARRTIAVSSTFAPVLLRAAIYSQIISTTWNGVVSTVAQYMAGTGPIIAAVDRIMGNFFRRRRRR